uniref:Uncharacterized protein n=1 Tax=Tetranychus urticae TaxID=32264 RepID=T1KV26_TETUR
MNSKILFAFVLTVNICIITATTQVYTYGMFVRTADKEFDSDVEGKLKLAIMSTNTKKTTQEDFVLTPNDIKIKKDKTYATTISSIAPLDNITSTLASQDNPVYSIEKPTIYFDSIILSMFTLKSYPDYDFRPETNPIEIKHADGTTLGDKSIRPLNICL